MSADEQYTKLLGPDRGAEEGGLRKLETVSPRSARSTRRTCPTYRLVPTRRRVDARVRPSLRGGPSRHRAISAVWTLCPPHSPDQYVKRFGQQHADRMMRFTTTRSLPVRMRYGIVDDATPAKTKPVARPIHFAADMNTCDLGAPRAGTRGPTGRSAPDPTGPVHVGSRKER